MSNKYLNQLPASAALTDTDLIPVENAADSTHLRKLTIAELEAYMGTGLHASTHEAGEADEINLDGLGAVNTGAASIGIKAGSTSLAVLNFGDSADDDIGKIVYDNNQDWMKFYAFTANFMIASSWGVNMMENLQVASGKTFYSSTVQALTSEVLSLNDSAGATQLTLDSSGIALKTGAAVDTIETTLTNDATHLATSSAIYAALSGAGGATTLDDLTDVTLDVTIGELEVLSYDLSAGDFINRTLSEAGIAAASHSHDGSHIITGIISNVGFRTSASGKRAYMNATDDNISLWSDSTTEEIRLDTEYSGITTNPILFIASDDGAAIRVSKNDVAFGEPSPDQQVAILHNAIAAYNTEASGAVIFASRDGSTDSIFAAEYDGTGNCVFFQGQKQGTPDKVLVTIRKYGTAGLIELANEAGTTLVQLVDTSGNGKVWAKDGFECYLGAAINEFSTDGTMSGNSDTAVPTEQAVVEYMAAHIAAYH